uniref:Uncharacterized protein n=1 Tax=Acrobeloides nanus TaxID=290746 RepID=A0A914DD01_9BILA
MRYKMPEEMLKLSKKFLYLACYISLESINGHCGKPGFEARTKLAILHYNRLVEADDAGERTISYERKVYSKAKGDVVTKKIKTPIQHEWKKNIAEGVLQRKLDNLAIPFDENIEDEVDLDVELDDDYLIQKIIDMELEDEDDFDLSALNLD